MNLNIKSLNNLLANIKTNYISKNKYSKVKYSKNIIYILHFLKKKGYIISFKINKKVKTVYIFIKYYKGKPLFNSIVKYSKPSNILTLNNKKLTKFSKKNSFAIVNTKKGLMFAKEASKLGHGGVILFELKN